VRERVAALGFVAHIRSRGEEREHKRRNPDWRARRWVVEGTHSWLNRNRSILIRWSKKPENNLALLHLASGLIAWKAAIANGLTR
jgi:putative transposase